VVGLNSNEMIQSFIHDMEIRGMTKESRNRYAWCLGDFASFLEARNKDLIAVSKSDFRDYVEALKTRNVSTNTAGLYLAALSSFYDFVVFEEMLPANPVKAIRKRYLASYKSDGEEHTHKIVSTEEAARIINALVDIRDKALVLLLFKTGIRRKELIALDVSDINWQEQSILLKTTKKRSNRLVFFDDETAAMLSRWLKARKMRAKEGETALFLGTKGRLGPGGINKIITKAAIRAGLHDTQSNVLEDHFSAHCCRHWFTTYLIRAGMRRDHIKELRGDARREAMDLYNHIDKKELQESYLAHIPQLGI
jgi:integrase/recombinase XerD